MRLNCLKMTMPTNQRVETNRHAATNPAFAFFARLPSALISESPVLIMFTSRRGFGGTSYPRQNLAGIEYG